MWTEIWEEKTVYTQRPRVYLAVDEATMELDESPKEIIEKGKARSKRKTRVHKFKGWE